MDFAALYRNATLKLILFDRGHMGGLNLIFVIHQKQKRRFVMSYEESTRASTDASGRACAANNCYRKKNPFTTTFYCYATTFNMNAAKALHLLQLQHQKQRTVTICQNWHAE